MHPKITDDQLARQAIVYVRQSSLKQVLENTESTERQYALVQKAADYGWPEAQIVVIDEDQGRSAASAVNRSGFQQLVSAVGLGQVGLVLALEISRFARSQSDWYRVLELAAVCHTLIADEDGLYDPQDHNDRLLLGLKGTLSEAELWTIRSRLQGGRWKKARKGELAYALPVGYVCESDSRVGLDPDQQVQTTLRTIFQQFRLLGSTPAVLRYFRDHQLPMPRGVMGASGPEHVVWKTPTYEAIYLILTNPTYAGAYAYERRKPAPNQRRRSAVGSAGAPEDAWAVLMPDVYPAYVTWAAYRQYLLRGLIKCGVCGLTYSGVGWRGTGDKTRTYYSCNGRQAYRGIYGSNGKKCPSKAISGDIEDKVWNDIVEFGRNPGSVLEQLTQAQHDKLADADRLDAEIKRLGQAMHAKATERDQAITWCRRGMIGEAEMERQLGEIRLEEAALTKELDRLTNLAQSAETASAQLKPAEKLLVALNQKLDQPVTWELKRQLVETLVREILVETVEVNGKKEAIVHISYRFGPPEEREATLADNHTDIRVDTCLVSAAPTHLESVLDRCVSAVGCHCDTADRTRGITTASRWIGYVNVRPSEAAESAERSSGWHRLPFVLRTVFGQFPARPIVPATIFSGESLAYSLLWRSDRSSRALQVASRAHANREQY